MAITRNYNSSDFIVDPLANYQFEGTVELNRDHDHYFKKCGYEYVDVYRVLEMFEVTNPCIAHAVKKLLVAGGRGHKDIDVDIQDAIDTLERWKEMRDEE